MLFWSWSPETLTQSLQNSVNELSDQGTAKLFSPPAIRVDVQENSAKKRARARNKTLGRDSLIDRLLLSVRK